MDDKKVGIVFSIIFGSLILLFIIILLVLLFFGGEIKEIIKDGFSDDEPISIFYQKENYYG
ncbi:hypothetical protein GN156_14315 [bacterium LRH843]|nr:hypothetical protein [bacterium LRH843]